MSAFDMSTIMYVLIGIVVNVVVNSFFVWLAGKALVGSDKAKFSDAIWIVVLGAFTNGIIGAVFSGLVGSIIAFVLWLGLIKHFFDCGWGRAFVISVLAVIIQFVISFVLGILFNIAIFTLGL